MTKRNIIPDQSGKVIIITGANSGIGFEAAKKLSTAGAKIVMACRNPEKGEKARKEILEYAPAEEPDLMLLDLSSQESIRTFSNEFLRKYNSLDVLINNAGLMATPKSKTKDGFEMQFGTNHLGHFTLTGLMLDVLLKTHGSRVVTVTSIAHFNGSIDFNDINLEKSYSRMGAYRRSKLANMVFAYELQRRFSSAGKESLSIAVHPGVASTNIVSLPPVLKQLEDLVLASAAKGARTVLMGATDPSLKGGEYIGPGGWRQAYGSPAILESSPLSHDEEIAKKLWEISEKMTGIIYNID